MQRPIDNGVSQSMSVIDRILDHQMYLLEQKRKFRETLRKEEERMMTAPPRRNPPQLTKIKKEIAVENCRGIIRSTIHIVASAYALPPESLIYSNYNGKTEQEKEAHAVLIHLLRSMKIPLDDISTDIGRSKRRVAELHKIVRRRRRQDKKLDDYILCIECLL